MKVFTANWEYKVISVFFAIALYFYFSDQIAIGKTLRVSQFGVDNIVVPEDWVVIDVDPPRLEIGISGPKSMLQPLAEALQPVIHLSNEDCMRQQPVVTKAVTTRMLGLDPKIQIERVGPQADIQVRVERVEEKRLPLSDQIAVRLPEGLSYRLALERTDVLVRGPASLLDDLRAIEVRPVDLTDESRDLAVSHERIIPLVLIMPQAVEQVGDEAVEARVTILPVPSKRVVQVPVHTVTPPDFAVNYRVSLDQEEVTVTVRGPQVLLDELNPDTQIKALVTIDPKDPDWVLGQPRNLPLRFDAPSWLSAAPSQLRVTLDLRRPGPDQPAGAADQPAPGPDQSALPVEE